MLNHVFESVHVGQNVKLIIFLSKHGILGWCVKFMFVDLAVA
jgi:hypothetical protein